MGIEEFKLNSESLYIWDDIEQKGFPLTDSVYCVDLSGLSHEERTVISGGDSNQIAELVKENGGRLSSLLEMSFHVFKALMRGVYMHESDEKKNEIQKLVSSLLDEDVLGLDDE